MSTRLENRVVAKTANYTIRPPMDRPGTKFTNRGAAGPVVFTLPVANRGLTGYWYRFKCLSNNTVQVQSAGAGGLITFNNAAATSLAIATASQQIGGEIEASCDGVAWTASGIAAASTYTVA